MESSAHRLCRCKSPKAETLKQSPASFGTIRKRTALAKEHIPRQPEMRMLTAILFSQSAPVTHSRTRRAVRSREEKLGVKTASGKKYGFRKNVKKPKGIHPFGFLSTYEIFQRRKF